MSIVYGPSDTALEKTVFYRSGRFDPTWLGFEVRVRRRLAYGKMECSSKLLECKTSSVKSTQKK